MNQSYVIAREQYRDIGVDTDAAVAALERISISMQCWQGDDVRGFLFRDRSLSGGIQATGNYPGRARTPRELREDMEVALRLVPGHHRVSLHAIYADTEEQPDLDSLEPCHFASWVEWAKEKGLGLDFNQTLFSHPRAESGFTLSSADEGIRSFWVEHCKRAREIGAYFGRELNSRCVTNLWIADGWKDTPIDRAGPRQRLEQSLNEIYARELDPRYHLDALESKLFGIGSESYVVGSHEFYMGYAVKHGKAITLDTGHFHPTEQVSNKISALLLFTPELLLHVSRPVRWDSDHVVILDDELREIAHELIRGDLLDRVHIGLDYFDASINRVAAWVIGMRSMQKALLLALLEPSSALKELERAGDLTGRLAYLENLKSMPWQAVWEWFCEKNGVPLDWLPRVRRYEMDVLANREAH